MAAGAPDHVYPQLAPDGQLIIQRCAVCGRTPSFARVRCPGCFGPLKEHLIDGYGEIISFTVVYRPQSPEFALHVPIVVVQVQLMDGPEIISSLLGDSRLQAHIGATVRIATRETWSSLPQFWLDPDVEDDGRCE